MSQTQMTDAEFQVGLDSWRARNRRRGATCGPSYSGQDGGAPLVWGDQIFHFELEPAGTVICGQPLRAGATQNGLEIILVASHANEGPVTAAAGATATLTLMQGDSEDGPFEEIGPTYCAKAPAEGISAGPCHLFIRFPLGNFTRPWLRAKLEFAGSISGGKLDCCLAYAAR